MRIFILAIFLAATPLTAANSQTYYADVNGATVNVHVPEGYCAITGESEGEAMMLEYLSTANAGVNDVLIVFADCQQLADWNGGARPYIDSFGYIATPLAPNLAEFPGNQDDLNAGMGPVFSEQFGEVLGHAMQQGADRAQSMLDDLESGIRIEETRPLGYFGYDPYGLYVGLVQKVSNQYGAEKTVVGVYSTIAVQQRLLYFYLWDAYSGDANQVNELLELTQRYSRNQHEVN